jgi:hypothetical protein
MVVVNGAKTFFKQFNLEKINFNFNFFLQHVFLSQHAMKKI